MELVIILALCFGLLFVVEVFLGGALPGEAQAPSPEGCPAPGRSRMGMGPFFGQALPLAATGIGLPMSLQHPWALLLVAGAGALYVVVCKVMKAC